ncbi:MAG: Crp/Fnr family transcriptional regulator [Ruminococcaceae bacterium]|nr:Crp/Fnr family transcriptional regulator [Oscillospiraceae bacterium]
MELSEFFSSWSELTDAQRSALQSAARLRRAAAGELIHGGSAECTGLLLVCSGRLRAYVASEDGREITLYRLLERDVCLFSASCAFRSLQFDIAIRAEEDSSFWVLPADAFQSVMAASAPLANEVNRIMMSRFSDVMWLLDQILWKSMDRRLAAFLLDEAALEGVDRLRITHETIASHMGTAREVVTRMLRYFQSEGMVALSRGAVELTGRKRLEALAQA